MPLWYISFQKGRCHATLIRFTHKKCLCRNDVYIECIWWDTAISVYEPTRVHVYTCVYVCVCATFLLKERTSSLRFAVILWFWILSTWCNIQIGINNLVKRFSRRYFVIQRSINNFSRSFGKMSYATGKQGKLARYTRSHYVQTRAVLRR